MKEFQPGKGCQIGTICKAYGCQEAKNIRDAIKSRNIKRIQDEFCKSECQHPDAIQANTEVLEFFGKRNIKACAKVKEDEKNMAFPHRD
jgi:hypothetical protein